MFTGLPRRTPEEIARNVVLLYCLTLSSLLACIRTYVHTYIRTYVHTYVRTRVHIRTYTYIRTCVHAYMRTYVHTYIHRYTHTHTHITLSIRGQKSYAWCLLRKRSDTERHR